MVEESKEFFIEMMTLPTRKYENFRINVNVDNKYFLPDSM
jgi:hypothetical protein